MNAQRQERLKDARRKHFEETIVKRYIEQQERRMRCPRPVKTAHGLLDLALEEGDVYDFLFGDYSYPRYGDWSRGIPTDWGRPLCFPYFDYRMMAMALVNRQEHVEGFNASVLVNEAVFNAIDPGYVRGRHSLDDEAALLARTLANISNAVLLAFFGVREPEIVRGASLAFSSKTLAALFQTAWLNEDRLRLVGCWDYLMHFTYAYPGSGPYMWDETRRVPDGYRDHAEAETCFDLYDKAMRRLGVW